MKSAKTLLALISIALDNFGVRSLFYFMALWLFMTIAVSLVFDDILRAAGIVSAYIIYQMINGYYQREIQERSQMLYEQAMKDVYAEPNEEKRL